MPKLLPPSDRINVRKLLTLIDKSLKPYLETKLFGDLKMPKSADQAFDPDNPQSLLDDLEELYKDEQLSGWEMAFITNIKSLIETDVPLTEHQLVKLKEIHQDYVE